MATYYPTINVTSATGTSAATLAGGDFAFIADAIAVANTGGGYAISAFNANLVKIFVEGTVLATGNDAIHLDGTFNSQLARQNTVQIAETGLVYGAIDLAGNSNLVENAGEIRGAGLGVYFNANGATSGSNTLTNTGLVQAQTAAASEGSIFFIVHNFGTISGGYQAINTFHSTLQLDNGGLISGQVFMQQAGGTIVNSGTMDAPTPISATVANIGVQGFTLRNTGEITSTEGTAIVLTAGASGEAPLDFYNAGTLVGDIQTNSFLALQNDGTIRGALFIDNDGLDFTNNGTWSGNITGSFASGQGGATYQISNYGTMHVADALAMFNLSPAIPGQIFINLRNAGLISGFVDLGSAGDVYDGSAGTVMGVVNGEDGNDQLIGGQGGDVLYGAIGADSILGGAGGDTLSGGDDDDDIDGGDGSDIVNGGAGADNLDGGAGADTLDYNGSSTGVYVNLLTGEAQFGEAAGDVFTGFEALRGSLGADTLSGGNAADTIGGNFGPDSLLGQGGADRLLGGDGADTLDGGLGMDILRGGTGNDLLLGGTGNDTLRGEAGADTLVGGAGADALLGGAGNDVFRFVALGDSSTTAATRDRILDFVQGQDRIDLASIDAIAGMATNDAFTLLTTPGAAFTAAGQIRFVNQADGNTRIELNVNTALVNNAQAPEAAILLVGTYTLTAADFVM